jgi:hypothetical protein
MMAVKIMTLDAASKNLAVPMRPAANDLPYPFPIRRLKINIAIKELAKCHSQLFS